MGIAGPPAADDDGAYIFIDHREEEGSIVAFVSERLRASRCSCHPLLTRRCLSRFGVRNIASPTHSRGTTAMSSYLSGGTSKTTTASSSWSRRSTVTPTGCLWCQDQWPRDGTLYSDHLTVLQLGFDYFGQIKVPTLNHEGSAPEFAREKWASEGSVGRLCTVFEAAFIKRTVDTGTAAAFAKLVMSDPKAKEEFGLSGDATEAEVTAKIQAELNTALQQANAEGPSMSSIVRW